MKILNQSDINSISFKEIRSTGAVDPVAKQVMASLPSLVTGDGIFISKQEWSLKTDPYFNNRVKGVKTSTRALKDGSGWVIIRK